MFIRKEHATRSQVCPGALRAPAVSWADAACGRHTTQADQVLVAAPHKGNPRRPARHILGPPPTMPYSWVSAHAIWSISRVSEPKTAETVCETRYASTFRGCVGHFLILKTRTRVGTNIIYSRAVMHLGWMKWHVRVPTRRGSPVAGPKCAPLAL